MRKAILVIDMPSSCKECLMAYTGYHSNFCFVARNIPSDIGHYVFANTKPDWCPLKPAPEEQEIWFDDERSDWERGYNNCVREIVGRE